ncbi:unnamed protein product [Didymodactylos carnosus]|uniref:C2H2-type domain-containing protein n=1 Tax=Didymodactylos carnosus TaxID=1234261 RepID=A0A813Q9P7_9BILA|nr:unnamed protein product [Didymodactylos carnosus]CAF0764127.1 unnamed protein product [Didymodactylos carnosus]CAF3501865.1 unnamed protein product [Didymodactylos carnosus]CAF3545294.1 unnamed protein product [Didymodactylos carnosus]
MASDSTTSETLISHQSRLTHTPWHSNNDLLHISKKISSLDQSSTSSETSTLTDSQSIDNSIIHFSDKHCNGENEIENLTEINNDHNTLSLSLNQINVNKTPSNDDHDQKQEEASSDISTKSYKNDPSCDFTSMSDNVKREQFKIQDHSDVTNSDDQQQQQQIDADQDELDEVSKTVKRITEETEQSEKYPLLVSTFISSDNSNGSGGGGGENSPKQPPHQDLSSSSSTPSYDNGASTSIDYLNSFIQSTTSALARTLSSSTTTNGSSSIYLHTRNSSKTLKCPKCNWHYKYQETLEIHMKEKHPDQETSCLYCLSSQLHPRLARGESYSCGYKPYRCEICNYSTTTKGNLSIHMQSDKHMNNIRECHQQTKSLISTISSNNSETHQQDTINSSSPPPPLSTEEFSTVESQTPAAIQSSVFRCDSLNNETNSRNLRIHMNSDKQIQDSQQKQIKNGTTATNEENDERSVEKKPTNDEISPPKEVPFDT